MGAADDANVIRVASVNVGTPTILSEIQVGLRVHPSSTRARAAPASTPAAKALLDPIDPYSIVCPNT